MELVNIIARRYEEKLPNSVTFDDLVSAGTIGLMDAATNFDSSRNVAFRTYAKHRIVGAMLDDLRNQDTVSRDRRRIIKLVDATRQELLSKTGEVPTVEEIAEHLHMTIEQVSANLTHSYPTSVDGGRAAYGSVVRKNCHTEEVAIDVRDNAPGPDLATEQREQRDALRRILPSLKPREQRIVLLYYFGEVTMKEIGAEMGINESRVSQIHKVALERLRVDAYRNNVQAESIL
jgi:RNA polymerase sigma factor for flagellar operon FliA